jgi:hypothetical protein
MKPFAGGGGGILIIEKKPKKRPNMERFGRGLIIF